MRKTGALLGTTFVLSLHAVFHNVICNWRNRAVQFLSIIVLGCPLQPCPPRARIHNTCACTARRPISRVLSRILWIFEQAERFCRRRGPMFPFVLAIRANTKARRDSILTVARSHLRVSPPGDSKGKNVASTLVSLSRCWKLTARAGNRKRARLFLSPRFFRPAQIPPIFFRGAPWLRGSAGITAVRRVNKTVCLVCFTLRPALGQLKWHYARDYNATMW